MRFPGWLKAILVFLLLLGVTFRFVNLNHKAFWHDEVYTSMRVAGYTRLAIDEELFQNRVVPIGDLQKFQHIKPGSTVVDTLRSLAAEDPQHPPLYFAIARLWMQWFGGSLTASRLLPALLSLLGLPLMYALAWELFASHAVALLATTLLALSPFDVLFAQTARQYSFLTVTVILSQWLLVRVLRGEMRERRSRGTEAQKKRLAWRDWGLYALSVALGMYTQPFFGLTVMGQVVYLALEALFETQRTIFQKQRYVDMGRVLIRFGGAIALSIVLYTPWIYVLIKNRQRALATTNWANDLPGIGYLVKYWTLSFSSLFVDLYFDTQIVLTFVLRALVIGLMVVSLYTVCRCCERSTWLLILTSVLVPFLALALPDLILVGKRSTVTRYLISSFPGIQLAVAYFLSTKLSAGGQPLRTANGTKSARRKPPTASYFSFVTPHSLSQWFWRGSFALLLVANLASLTESALADTWWNKDLSFGNPQVARYVNAAVSPVIISDIGDDWTNTGDLISLSYITNPNVKLMLLSADANWAGTQGFANQLRGNTALTFRPTRTLKSVLDKNYGPLQSVVRDEGRFWKLSQ